MHRYLGEYSQIEKMRSNTSTSGTRKALRKGSVAFRGERLFQNPPVSQRDMLLVAEGRFTRLGIQGQDIAMVA